MRSLRGREVRTKDPGRKAVCSDCPAGTSFGFAAIKLVDCTCIRGFSGESDETGSRFSALSLGARSLALSRPLSLAHRLSRAGVLRTDLARTDF